MLMHGCVCASCGWCAGVRMCVRACVMMGVHVCVRVCQPTFYEVKGLQVVTLVCESLCHDAQVLNQIITPVIR